MLLTVRQVAKQLNVSRQCVYWLVGERLLLACRLGERRRAIRIQEQEVNRYLEDARIPWRANRVTPPAISTPSAFRQLNANRLRRAWAKRGIDVKDPQ